MVSPQEKAKDLIKTKTILQKGIIQEVEVRGEQEFKINFLESIKKC